MGTKIKLVEMISVWPILSELHCIKKLIYEQTENTSILIVTIDANIFARLLLEKVATFGYSRVNACKYYIIQQSLCTIQKTVVSSRLDILSCYGTLYLWYNS